MIDSTTVFDEIFRRLGYLVILTEQLTESDLSFETILTSERAGVDLSDGPPSTTLDQR